MPDLWFTLDCFFFPPVNTLTSFATRSTKYGMFSICWSEVNLTKHPKVSTFAYFYFGGFVILIWFSRYFDISSWSQMEHVLSSSTFCILPEYEKARRVPYFMFFSYSETFPIIFRNSYVPTSNGKLKTWAFRKRRLEHLVLCCWGYPNCRLPWVLPIW